MNNLDFKKYITFTLGFNIDYSLSGKKGYLVYNNGLYYLELYTNHKFSLMSLHNDIKYLIYSTTINKYNLLDQYFLKEIRKQKLKQILK